MSIQSNARKGLPAICGTCGLLLPEKIIFYCKRCKTGYCSDSCLEQEKVCFVPTYEQATACYQRFGLFDTGKLPCYNGRSIFWLPGPISGNVPKTLYSIHEEPGKSVWKTFEPLLDPKSAAQVYYLVDIGDLPKSFFMQLTPAQRTEIVTKVSEQWRFQVSK
jgi:hypothetical protein